MVSHTVKYIKGQGQTGRSVKDEHVWLGSFCPVTDYMSRRMSRGNPARNLATPPYNPLNRTSSFKDKFVFVVAKVNFSSLKR